MSRKTLQEEACILVPEFRSVCEKVIRQFTISGKSKSCVQNYLRQASKLTTHYQKSPLDLSVDELEEYLYHLRLREKTSLSSFKHLVYGLRTIYALYDRDDLHLSLPNIESRRKLPVVLSIEEVKRLLQAPKLLKHRILFGVIYDGGLRISEVINLRLIDVDLERGMLHIRESKCKKDRYVPISEMTVRGIRNYLSTSKPRTWLFNGRVRGEPISREGIRHALRSAKVKAGIDKNACVHTLRHSYATHLLELGLDLVSVKNQLGHAEIGATMMYLHIARVSPSHGFSPLSRIYQQKNE